MSLDEQLRVLFTRSANLKEKSERLNNVIAGIEAKINEAAPGVTFWDIERICIVGEEKKWGLGYCYIDKTWCLAARKDLGEPVPLLKAPRLVRLHALRFLGPVIEGLTANVGSYADQVEDALDDYRRGPPPTLVKDGR